jgi:hypothetical protein
MLNYTDTTQNTCMQSLTVCEIIAIENCGLSSSPRTISVSCESYLSLPVGAVVLMTKREIQIPALLSRRFSTRCVFLVGVW